MRDMHVSDDALVQQFLDGDESSFRELIDRYGRRLFLVALNIFGNPDEAEDAVQETFVKVFKSLKRYEPRDQFSHWLHRILKNECLKCLKDRKRYVDWEKVDFSIQSSDMNPEKNILEGENQRIIRQAIEKLKPEYQTIISLRYFSEMSYNEISQIMGISHTTVETWLFRARKRLGITLNGLLK